MCAMFISAKDICKVYENKIAALNRVSFKTSSRIVALIGPNGAGKTTFVKIASGLINMSSGSLKVLGFDVSKDYKLLQEKIAFMPQDSQPDSGCTPYEHVKYYLIARGYSFKDASRIAREILEELGLWEKRNVTCMRLSGGLRRLVLLAMILIPEVSAIFLDEPTNGLDPINRIKIWNMLRRIVSKEKHVLVTSHDMNEVEEYVEEVVMIHKGQIILQGSPRELVKNVSNLSRVEIVLEGEKDTFKNMLNSMSEVEKIIDIGTSNIVYVYKNDLGSFLEKLSKENIKFYTDKCGLKDVFLRMVK